MLNPINLQPPPTPADIVKNIKRTFLRAAPSEYTGEKIFRRTSTTIALKRSPNDWKGDFHRRTEQESSGFFSSISQPYSELGETELDTKQLVFEALKEIGGLFNDQVDQIFFIEFDITAL